MGNQGVDIMTLLSPDERAELDRLDQAIRKAEAESAQALFSNDPAKDQYVAAYQNTLDDYSRYFRSLWIKYKS